MASQIPGDPKRLLIAGDTHGNYLHWKNILLPAAREHHVDGIVQLGDFGYWPLTADGREYVEVLTGQLAKANLWIVFVDGNHEDHKALLQLPARADGLVEITPSILWAPRGHRWTWHDVRFLALGGAFSIDRKFRKLDSGLWGWFEEETVTAAQAQLAMEGGPTDVVLTHDAPMGALPQDSHTPVKYEPATLESAKHIQAVAETTKPKLLLHGHWHQFQQVRLQGQGTEVIGLSMDGTRKSWIVLDLPGLEIIHEREDVRIF
jgi:predicted phosphodiesterase